MLGFSSYIKTGCEIVVRERIRAFLFEKMALRAEEIFVLYTPDNVGKLKSDLYKKINDWFETEKAAADDQEPAPDTFPKKWLDADDGEKVVNEAKDEYYVALDIYEESLQAYENFKKYWHAASGIDWEDPKYHSRFYTATPTSELVESDDKQLNTFSYYVYKIGQEYKAAHGAWDNLYDTELIKWLWAGDKPPAMGLEWFGSVKKLGKKTELKPDGTPYTGLQAYDLFTPAYNYVQAASFDDRNKLRCSSTRLLKNLKLGHSKGWTKGHAGTAGNLNGSTLHGALSKQLGGGEYNQFWLATEYCTRVCENFEQKFTTDADSAKGAMDNAYKNLKYAAFLYNIELPVGEGFIDELKKEHVAKIPQNKLTKEGSEKVSVDVIVSPYKMYLYAAAVIDPRDENANKLKPDIFSIESKIKTWEEEEGLIKCTETIKNGKKEKACVQVEGLSSLDRLYIRKKIAVKMEAEGKMKLRAIFRKEVVSLLQKFEAELLARGVKQADIKNYKEISAWLETETKNTAFDLQIIDPGTVGELITYKETIDSMLYDLISSVGV